MKTKGMRVLLCCLLIFGLLLTFAACNQEEEGEGSNEDAQALLKALLERDSEVVDIFYNGKVEYDATAETEDGYYPVKDSRFASLDTLKTYVSGIYSDQAYLETLLVDGNFVERDGQLYVHATITKNSYPLPDLSAVTVRGDLATDTVTIEYSFGDHVKAEITAQRVNDVWLLSKSHGQVLAELDMLGVQMPTPTGGVQVYDPDTESYKEIDVEIDDPIDAVAAVGEQLGLRFELNGVSINGDRAVVDFKAGSQPVANVGGEQELAALNSIAKSLMSAYPTVTSVCFRVDGGDYASDHYEFGADEPFSLN